MLGLEAEHQCSFATAMLKVMSCSRFSTPASRGDCGKRVRLRTVASGKAALFGPRAMHFPWVPGAPSVGEGVKEDAEQWVLALDLLVQSPQQLGRITKNLGSQFPCP